MNRTVWLAGVAAVCALAGAAQAQTTPEQTATPQSAASTAAPTGPIQDAPAVDAGQRGVLVFEPAFFTDQRPDTALDMIERVPGFDFDEGDTGQRGFSGAAGNVLIDGDRPASKSDGLEAVLQRISAASVERIELIRGGAPGIDMQGRAVVANVVLRRTVTVERVLEANAYLYPDGYVGPVLAGSISRRDGDDQIEASLSATTDRTQNTAQGYRRRFDADGTLIQDAGLDLRDRVRRIEGTGVIQRRIAGGRARANALVEVFDNRDRQALTIRTGAGQDSLNEEESEGLNGELGLNWTGDLSPRTGLELTGLQRWSTQDYVGVSRSADEVSTFSTDATSGESIVRAVLRHRPSEPWAVEAGAEVAYNFLDSRNALSEDGAPVPLPSASVKVEELRGEAFGQATWRPSPRFTLEAGVRVELSEIRQSGDSDQAKTFVYPKPRLQATWTPGADHQIRLRIEREVGQLDFGDFVASADIDLGQVEGGNPDLEPDKTTVFELVYERRFWGEGALTLTAEHGEVQDVVDVIPLAGGFDAVGNIGDGRYDLLEAELTLPMDRFGLSNARLQLEAYLFDSEVVDPLTGEARRFQGEPPFGCGIEFNQDLDGGRFAYGFDHDCDTERGEVFRIRERRRAYDEPELVLYGQWKPSASTTVRLDIGNATDRAFGVDRQIFSGPRDRVPVAFRETRRLRRDPFLYLQVRRTF